MRIEILCTGDEVLSGKTINTNYSHMARRLQEVGLDVLWGTTVGDSRESLVEAFRLAASRADAVIVNGGLGPTVDDLSQEVAAEAAGVGLELNEAWLKRIEDFYVTRGRIMPPNNRKQAMLPEGSEFIDNPVGTACGFALDIGQARFFFTPGVPREINRMLEDQLIPRLLSLSGTQTIIRLKRFHSFGLGESRVDNMLSDIEALDAEGAVKLGFQAHYPQLETKLFARGASEDELDAKLNPLAAVIRERLGGYLLAEDTQTLEGQLLAALVSAGATVAVAELGTHGAVAGRLAAADKSGEVFQRGILGASLGGLARALQVKIGDLADPRAAAIRFAAAIQSNSAASFGLAVVVAAPALANEGWVHIAVCPQHGSPLERSACLVGGAERVRVGAVEMSLDCIRRLLQGLPTAETIDFEKQS